MKKILGFVIMLLMIQNGWSYSATITVHNLCTNIVSGVSMQGDIGNDAVTSWSDKRAVSTIEQPSGKMSGSGSSTFTWETYTTAPYNLRVAYYTNATGTGTRHYTDVSVISTNSPNATIMISVCSGNPCIWYYSWCYENKTPVTRSFSIWQGGSPMCTSEGYGSAWINVEPGQTGCLKGGPLCTTDGIEIRYNPAGVGCLTALEDCIAVCEAGWAPVPGASPDFAPGAPPSTGGNPGLPPDAGTEVDSGSLSNVVWSGSATNLENVMREGVGVLKDAIDQNTLSATKNTTAIVGAVGSVGSKVDSVGVKVDNLGSVIEGSASDLMGAIGNLTNYMGGEVTGSNYMAVDQSWTNNLDAIRFNQTNTVPMPWSAATNYSQAKAYADVNAAGGQTLLENYIDVAEGGYHESAGPGAGTISIPLGSFTMTVDPMSGQWSPVWSFAHSLMTWILCAAYLFMISKDAYTLVRDMGQVRPVGVPNLSVLGTNITGAALGPVFLVACLAIYAVGLAIWSSAGWGVAINMGGGGFLANPFSGVGGSVGIGLGWFATCFPLDLFMALTTSSIVWKLTMAKALWVTTMMLKALVGS